MSTLTLVRHGQSESLGRERGLTPLGEAQAQALARYWLKNRIQFDEVYSGTLARQVRTEQIVAECVHDTGLEWPAATRDRAWNEYDATGVLAHDAQIGELVSAYERARGSADENRQFQRMLEAAMLRWLDANTIVDGVEPWPSFRDRVLGAMRRVMDGPSGRRVAVFTSGGVIGFCVHLAMKAPSRSFLDVNWRVRNCSVTEFVFDRDRLTLDSFNSIGHLDDARLLTYR